MKWLITGGSGFIGSAIALRLLNLGHDFLLLDLVEPTLDVLKPYWIKTCNLGYLGEVHDYVAYHQDIDVCVHAGAQTAVTKSIKEPFEDFTYNAIGTFNVLESFRILGMHPLVIMLSTNKIYGSLSTKLKLSQMPTRWTCREEEYRHGISEFSFYPNPQTPYAVSKYCAELYCKEYTRTYGINTVILRLSCIYGPTQNGTEDQGWIMHMIKCAIDKKPFTIFGDGKQVRDCLFIDDLVNLIANIPSCNKLIYGDAYNVGGGPHNSISLLELFEFLEARGHEIRDHESLVKLGPARMFDQKWFISDTRKITNCTEWNPATGLAHGLEYTIGQVLKAL